MELLHENILYINIIILLAGATSVHLGASFLRRERHTRGFFKYSVFLLALGNGLCLMGYSIMSISTNLTFAYYFRLLGLIGIDIYLIAEFILVTSCLNFSNLAEYFIIGLASIAALFDVVIYGSPQTNTFVRYDNYTGYVSQDPYRHIFHYTYVGVLAICMLIMGISWAISTRYKRERRLVLFAFISNIIFAISSLPDFLNRSADIGFIYVFYCIGIFFAFVVFYNAANNYMVFYITVNSISRDIFSTLAVGLLVFDTDYHLNLSNEYANKLLGLDREPQRIRLKEIFKLNSGEPLKMFEMAAGGDDIDYRLTSQVTDKVILVNFSCKFDRSNQPMCYILVATDLTEENRLIEEAQAANETKSQFISNISHEIRTPINIIAGNDELILREAGDASILRYAENINIAAKNLTSLINDILDFSKIESGRLEIISREYSIKTIINDIYNMFFSLAIEKNQTLSFSCSPMLPSMLNGDEVRIKQIISNLLSNAVKYTPDNGNIQVDADFKKSDDSHIILILKVTDTGIGIRDDDIPFLFEDFRRFELDRNRSIQGTGLGLSITKHLVTLLHGTIDVHSDYGKGSVFVVEIPQPIIDATPIGEFNMGHSIQPTKYQVSFTAPEARIFAVDDVQMNLDVFTGLLKNTNMKIDVALSGAAALSMLNMIRYDMIFLDHMMPEMDGVEVLKRLKSNKTGPNINTPVIMLTANAMMNAEQKYLEEGFNDYLSKPINPNVLNEMIIKYLPSQLVTLSKTADDTATDVLQMKDKSELIKALDFIDVKSGLEFAAGDEDFYRQIVTTYINEDKRPQLNQFLESEDWSSYQIVAHSLKGTSLTIGAKELSDAAKGLEFAVKENRIEYIRAHHSEVMEQYGVLLDKLDMAMKNV